MDRADGGIWDLLRESTLLLQSPGLFVGVSGIDLSDFGGAEVATQLLCGGLPGFMLKMNLQPPKINSEATAAKFIDVAVFAIWA